VGNFKKSWEMEVGLNNVPSYQASGRPFCTGAVNSTGGDSHHQVINFPYVTRWVTIVNRDDDNAVKVGFSLAGIEGSNYFTVPKIDGSPGQLGHTSPLPLKVSQIWLTGSRNVDIVAGLTTIRPERTNTTDGPSWSGSAGVG
tara:strand:+ start:323 stop:748 length:426 start_codon:yes stop_codon:yes gene_type:complete